MQEIRTPAQEAAEDIFFGQVVIIWARWFVIVAATIIALWSSNSVNEMITAVLLVVPLITINFFLHGRYLMERPVNRQLLMAIALADLIMISLSVLLWSADRGLNSPFFVFYYPVLLAFAFVFPQRLTAVYTVFALLTYTGACLVANIAIVGDSLELERLVMRLITLAAMGALGTYYWRIQRERRRAIPERWSESQLALPEQ